MSVSTYTTPTRIHATAAVLAAAAALSLTACTPGDGANSASPSTTVTSPATVVVTEIASPTAVSNPGSRTDSDGDTASSVGGGSNGAGDGADSGTGDGTGGASTTTPPDHGEATATPADFIGKWSGHTRTLNITADGTGDMLIAIGAADGEKWSLTWTLAGDELDMQLGPRIASYGTGLDGSMYEGARYAGILKRDAAGVLYLNMTGFGPSNGGVTWCSSKYGNSQVCGA